MKSRSGCFFGLSKGRLLVPEPHPRRAATHGANTDPHEHNGTQTGGGGGGEWRGGREAEDSPVEYKQQTHIKTHPQSTNSKLGWGVSSRIQSANTAKIDSPAEYNQQTPLRSTHQQNTNSKPSCRLVLT